MGEKYPAKTISLGEVKTILSGDTFLDEGSIELVATMANLLTSYEGDLLGKNRLIWASKIEGAVMACLLAAYR